MDTVAIGDWGVGAGAGLVSSPNLSPLVVHVDDPRAGRNDLRRSRATVAITVCHFGVGVGGVGGVGVGVGVGGVGVVLVLVVPGLTGPGTFFFFFFPRYMQASGQAGKQVGKQPTALVCVCKRSTHVRVGLLYTTELGWFCCC